VSFAKREISSLRSSKENAPTTQSFKEKIAPATGRHHRRGAGPAIQIAREGKK
jgi:hypothetical protein